MHLSNKLAIPPLILLSGLNCLTLYALYVSKPSFLNIGFVYIIIYLSISIACFIRPFFMDLEPDKFADEIKENHKAVYVGIGYIMILGIVLLCLGIN